MSETIKKISTTALAKAHNITGKELFAEFMSRGWVERKDDTWCLTEPGKAQGASYIESKKYGKYIVWPDNIAIKQSRVTTGPLITATMLGKAFDLSAQKINFILSEIGWAKKGIKGWLATEQGIKQGAMQSEDAKSGVPYIRWPQTIIDNKTLIHTIADVTGTTQPRKETSESQNETETTNFRDKFKAEHRATDGHFTRSKAEMLIDNWLYMFEVVHAYERKLPIEEEVYSDFYIPTGKVYIEYWGYENDSKYLARKKKKQEIYKKYNLNLIELEDKDVQNLDDVLPRMLLKYGVQTY